MSRRSHITLSVAAFVVLFVLHHDGWRDDSDSALLFGWLPQELAYRLAWMGGAFLFLVHLTSCVWKEGRE